MYLVACVHDSGRLGAVYQHRIEARCAENLRRLSRRQATGWAVYLVALPATARRQVHGARWHPEGPDGEGYSYAPELLERVASRVRRR